jgi:hypothetical protein
MDINMGDNNSMESLSLSWIAFFNDGKIIKQYEEGIEHRFQEVKDNLTNLIRFSLVNKNFSICFTVELKNGFILYNNYRGINLEEIEYKENIRLIFFRRHTVEIGENLKQKKHTIIYHLGFQYNDKEGNNRQIVLKIDSEGNWFSGD